MRQTYLHRLLGLLGLALLLVGCSGGGGSGSLSPQAMTSPQLEQEAVQGLLDLYRIALLEEDIDRLQGLLEGDGGAFEGTSFLDAMADTFRRLSVTELQLTEVTVPAFPTPLSVSFQQTLSVEDRVTLEQRTTTERTTLQLSRRQGASGTVTFLIAAVRREGPQWQVTMRGQVVAGAPTRVEVTETTATAAIAGVELEVPETGVVQRLTTASPRFHGTFIPPALPNPRPLQVRIRGPGGETVTLSHRYRVRVLGEGVVEKIAQTGSTRLFAVALAPHGTVWSGGDGGALYRVPPGVATATLIDQLLPDPIGRVEDLVIDQLGRLHAIVFSRLQSGDIVFDQGVLCQTVNVFDASYPFRVQDPEGAIQPTASTRAAAAGGSDIWLFGSDDGVARVTDLFRAGNCPEGGVAVRYDPILRRQAGGLLSNTVPALAVSADGTLWFGTAFGLTRLKDQQFTPLPFDRELSFRGDVATLEAFFREVAQAIFNLWGSDSPKLASLARRMLWSLVCASLCRRAIMSRS